MTQPGPFGPSSATPDTSAWDAEGAAPPPIDPGIPPAPGGVEPAAPGGVEEGVPAPGGVVAAPLGAAELGGAAAGAAPAAPPTSCELSSRYFRLTSLLNQTDRSG